MDGGHAVEPQLGEVRQLLAVEGIGEQVREDEADAAEAAGDAANAGELGQLHRGRRTDDDALHTAATIDKEPDASVELP